MPTAAPTGAPTLTPGDVAVISDKWTGNRARGQPSDAVGNVHIYYGDEEIVGEHAHFDGLRTITITGHPFLINHEHDSVLTADVIVFDTVSETAKLMNGNGSSDEGVERGLVHFSASDLHTDPDGVAHGLNPYVTTCENPRGGYHVTGKDMDVYPGDKIVISKAVLWLGAAAVFYLPLLVIPLRSVENQRGRTALVPRGRLQLVSRARGSRSRFPSEKTNTTTAITSSTITRRRGSGSDTSASTRAVRASAASASTCTPSTTSWRAGGRRTRRCRNRRTSPITCAAISSSRYQSNYGPLISIPPNETLSEAIVHQTAQTSQNYSLSHTSVGGQSSSNSFTFTDTRQFNQNWNQTVTYDISESNATFGGVSNFSNQSEFDYLMQYTTAGADYQVEFDKTYS